MAAGAGSEILSNITAKFNIQGEVRREGRIWLDAPREGFVGFCRWLKEQGFQHLSAISAVDWPNEGVLELAYHLWSYSARILVTAKVKIDRQNAVFDSVTEVWDGSAQAHEREIHELFGITFEGNSNLTPLFLEGWEGPPPFRKDFNWREYVGEEYYDRQNERELAYYD
ncbi:MAG: NADH-quinone oxidoreductase subunit C [Dehalococcoidia bacterium]